MQLNDEDAGRAAFYLGYYTTQHLIQQQLLLDYNQRVLDYVLTILDKLDDISEPNPSSTGATLEGYYVTKVEDIEFSPAYNSSSVAAVSDPAYLIRLLSRLLSIPLAFNLFDEDGRSSAYVAIQVR